MDIEVRPQKKARKRRLSFYVRRPLSFHARVEWIGKHRKWLPEWMRVLFLKMVRRRIGVDKMIALRDTALKHTTKEQVSQARENLRKAGLL